MAFSEAFDLFQFLGQLSRKDMEAYDKLTSEAQKAVAPFVLMRWMSGTSDPAQVIALNEFVNPYAFALGQDKALLCRLLAASATGRTNRYRWIKGPGGKAEKLRLEVIKQYYEISDREACDYKIDAETILAMADELGWDEDELKKLKKEVDESGRTEKPSSKPKKR